MIGGGILYSHSEFGGRVTFGFEAYGDGGNDCSSSGHGTHVAGVLGGRVAEVIEDSWWRLPLLA